jgi:DNA-directed RNA polymerase subunit omega
MEQPSLDVMLKTVDSKYTLVVAAAKRARMLTEGHQPLVNSKSKKPVTVALEEISANRIKYERTKTGIK